MARDINFELQQLIMGNEDHTIRADALIRDDADPRFTDDNWRTLLHHAAYAGGINNMGWLVDDHGLNVEARDYYNNTPAHLAAMAGHLDAIFWLADHGADMGARNVDNMTVRDVLLQYHAELIEGWDAHFGTVHNLGAVAGGTRQGIGPLDLNPAGFYRLPILPLFVVGGYGSGSHY